ncbi:glucosamine-6-phosphate deaminase [Humisphaera borealis]|uniref:Glucosamine-6-phosphate deaminase n=1 Tax=Humisphaera borealis TaxID=2807512 RepID=A0A7M2WSV0_9BACT|nr:glucosamine-6-phosphate deaminase [Humisphaera borealis]QOV88577.1 glucosamine-6-phosphate deaminase [Humisphaera borealis]
MKIWISKTKQDLGRRAASQGAFLLREALAANGNATIVVATGASQFEMYEALVAEPDIDWAKVEVLHLDEYVGLPATHPASFRRYLAERFISRLPVPPLAFHPIQGDADPAAECARLSGLIADRRIDVLFCGIGENGHLAFNDPPADFETEAPYHVVELDEACRRQQLGEGWFPKLSAVPKQAISMSIRQILSADAIVCSVPDARKADAVAAAMEGPVSPDVPASALQEHPNCTLFLDAESGRLLK